MNAPDAHVFFDRWYLGRAGELGVIHGLPSGHHVLELRTPKTRAFVGVEVVPGAVSLVREDLTAEDAVPVGLPR